MNSPIDILKDEHRTIERVLDALDRYAASAGDSDPETARKDLERFVEFIQLYADRIHHGKEEDILFERMVAMGFPRDSGPLAVMYYEHDQGRAFVSELKALGEQDAAWSEADRNRLNEAVRGYTTLLRNHIHKEDNILYPMAVSGLSQEAMQLVTERFEQFEDTESGRGEKERLRALAAELAAKYGD